MSSEGWEGSEAADVSALAFPAPLLTRADVEHLLARRAGAAADTAAIPWERVSLKE